MTQKFFDLILDLLQDFRRRSGDDEILSQMESCQGSTSTPQFLISIKKNQEISKKDTRHIVNRSISAYNKSLGINDHICAPSNISAKSQFNRQLHISSYKYIARLSEDTTSHINLGY